MEDYKIVNGFIVSPGKFEGEPEWILTLHEMVMSGMADHSVHDGTMAIDAFALDERISVLTGKPVTEDAYVCLWTDDNGFVNHMVMSENELFACEGFDIENDTTEYFVVDDFDDHPTYESGY
jgi:hypothetical protein